MWEACICWQQNSVKSPCGEESMRGRGEKTTTQPCGKGQRVFVLIANSVQTVKRSAALHQWNVRGTRRRTNGSMHTGGWASLTRLRTAPAGFCGSRRMCHPGQKKRRVRTRRKQTTAARGLQGALHRLVPVLCWRCGCSNRADKVSRRKQNNLIGSLVIDTMLETEG